MEDKSIWGWLIAAAVLIFLYLKIRKPPTTLPESKPSMLTAVTCAPPSGDTFPSNVPTIAAGNLEPPQRVITRPLTPSPIPLSHVVLPIDAPPPFSLIPNKPQSPVIAKVISNQCNPVLLRQPYVAGSFYQAGTYRRTI
jgi:hypothetical protein